jgi:choline dehydrogenase-like flavoprotein
MNYDLIVLGGGTAGLTAALTARHHGASVALVEREPRIGGDCSFYGCVPSKALIEIAQVAHDLERAHAEGIVGAAPTFDFAAHASSSRLPRTSATNASRAPASTSSTPEPASAMSTHLSSTTRAASPVAGSSSRPAACQRCRRSTGWTPSAS